MNISIRLVVLPMCMRHFERTSAGLLESLQSYVWKDSSGTINDQRGRRTHLLRKHRGETTSGVESTSNEALSRDGHEYLG